MAKIKEFHGLRPAKGLEEKVAELPYDVLNSAEAKVITGDNVSSFFHITKPEIDLGTGVDPYDTSVYEKGKEALESFIKNNTLIQDEKASLYLYTQVWRGKSQTGLVTCVSVDDYYNKVIKKHEFTRPDKEKDRTTHLDILNANTGPVFLLYREDGSKKSLFEEAMKIEPDYDFEAEDGVRHILRVIDNTELIETFKTSFGDDILYIADGHHRAASGASVGKLRREKFSNYSGDEEFNSFLVVIFPHDELQILAYNRAVKDLNGLTKDEYLEAVKKNFIIEESGKKEPSSTLEFSMYLDKKWYSLKPNFEISSDPIDSLDVKILQDKLLNPVLGIDDPRTSKRIDFIGGIRGTDELEKLVDSGDSTVAFSMYPTTVEQLMDVSDNDGIMPPKSTWFEPKLRSGLVVHLLD